MSQMREQRKFEQENNPHYLKGPSKPKVGVRRCGGHFAFLIIVYIRLMILLLCLCNGCASIVMSMSVCVFVCL